MNIWHKQNFNWDLSDSKVQDFSTILLYNDSPEKMCNLPKAHSKSKARGSTKMDIPKPLNSPLEPFYIHFPAQS